jgi:D-glycero-alpha-D-manno-heptose-7-phosphate kinase
MIMSRTPLRVSFVGGGSDLPAFFEREPGAVVSTAIDKYIYVMIARNFDGGIRVSHSETERVERVEDVAHDLIRASLELTGIDAAIDITSVSDIPLLGTGLGSSSAFTVGLLNALFAHRHVAAEAERLAREACEIEIDRCGKPIGKQDQYIAAYGGLRFITFTNGTVEVEPIECAPTTRRCLQARLLLLYTGRTRSADAILAEQSANIRTDAATRPAIARMAGLARQMRDALNRNDLNGFGEVLHANWEEKRRLARGIATPDIEAWYDTARAQGAVGGKLLGAGGGGFLLLDAPPESHADICRALPVLRPVPFRFEPDGSRIVYIDEHEPMSQ